MADLERPRLKVGFIPIIDCAPIVLAEELGAFERQGLEVEIRREVSWANVRDKLALGVLDASHILAPLPLAITLGVDSVTVPLVNVMTLQVNGNALTLSQSLWREMEEAAPDLVASGHAPLVARALAAVVRKRAASGAPQVVLASVFPYSAQNYMVRLWLSSGGLDPDRDVRLTCRATAAHRRPSLGRRDRRLLRRRAVEPARCRARHRPDRAHRPGDLEGHA
jgi:nitrate/nitrite transport system substrate-binding protein